MGYRVMMLLALVAAAAAAEPVVVERAGPTVHIRTFDPKKPPAEAQLGSDEAAITHASFLCEAGVSYAVTGHSSDGKGFSATIRVDGVRMNLSLEGTSFLPSDATKKLIAHEQAHRRIAETVYQDAELTARRLAGPLVGRSFTGTGSSETAASDAAAKGVIQKLSDDYMAIIPGRSARVNKTFDRLTDHGRNEVPEAEGIRKSFEEAGPTTRR